MNKTSHWEFRWLLVPVGSLRMRLTVAVAILAGAALTAGGILLVRAVESTVLRQVDRSNRQQLDLVRRQIEEGTPVDAVRYETQGGFVRVLRGEPPHLIHSHPGERGIQGTARAPHPPDSKPGQPDPERAVSAPHPPKPRPGQPDLECTVSAPYPSGPNAGPPTPKCVAPAPLPSNIGVRLPGMGAGHSGLQHAALTPFPALPSDWPPILPDPKNLPPGTWSIVQLPLMSPVEGPVTAVVMRPLADVRRSIETLSRVMMVGVPFLVILTTLAAWLLVGRALSPVREMSQRASGIADATAGDRLTVPPTYDEVAELALTLNGMLDRLAKGAQRQREFISDASHELRSPIAVLRTLVEVALAHPRQIEPKAVLEPLLCETLRLEALVGDMLTLARLDEGHRHVRKEIDLDDLVHEEAARPRSIPIDTREVEAVKVYGDRRSMMQLVRNLLDNAVRYASSRVAVSTFEDAQSVVLWVDDDGPGIPEQDCARVFDRFTRLESGRSRDTGGTGLGLALVRRIAEQHGGCARVDRSPDGGARLEVRLPSY